MKRQLPVGKEDYFCHEDLKWAAQGAGFVAAFCPNKDDAQRIVGIIRSAPEIHAKWPRARD